MQLYIIQSTNVKFMLYYNYVRCNTQEKLDGGYLFVLSLQLSVHLQYFKQKAKKKNTKGKRQYGGRNTYIHITEILSNMKKLNSCKKSANTTKKEQSQTIKTELSKELGKLEEQVKELLQKIVQKDNDRKQEGKILDIFRNKSGVPGKKQNRENAS